MKSKEEIEAAGEAAAAFVEVAEKILVRVVLLLVLVLSAYSFLKDKSGYKGEHEGQLPSPPVEVKPSDHPESDHPAGEQSVFFLI